MLWENWADHDTGKRFFRLLTRDKPVKRQGYDEEPLRENSNYAPSLQHALLTVLLLRGSLHS